MKTNLETHPAPPELPVEVLMQIVQEVANSDPLFSRRWETSTAMTKRGAEAHGDVQSMLRSFSMVKRSWNSACVEELYRHPLLTSRNYDLFVRTICPSVNLHVRKTELAAMVRVLDLSWLVFAGTKSFVARLLGRVKENLEILRAPQTSFAVNSLAALSKCQRLHTLDMSFVTESIPIDDFFRAIEKMPQLHTLSFPWSGFSPPRKEDQPLSHWPRRIRKLTVPPIATRMLSKHGPQDSLSLDTMTQVIAPSNDILSVASWALNVDTVRELCIYALPTGGSDLLASPPGARFTGHPMFNFVRVLEIHHQGNVWSRLQTLWDTMADYRSAGIKDGFLSHLEELVLGPYSYIFDNHIYAEGSFTLFLRHDPSWQEHSLRSVFFYYDMGPPKLSDELKTLHTRLIRSELDRVAYAKEDIGSATPYTPQECGVFLFVHSIGNDTNDARSAARPLWRPTGFDADAMDQWPHAHCDPLFERPPEYDEAGT